MRRTTSWFFAILAGLVAMAGGLLYAQYDLGYYTQENPGAITQPAPPRETDGATYNVAAYPLYPPALAPGEGREALESYCSTCHSTRYIIMQPPLPPDIWAAEVDKMVKMMGQPIPDDVEPVIIKYLQTPIRSKRANVSVSSLAQTQPFGFPCTVSSKLDANR